MINRIFFISESVYRLPAKAGLYAAIRLTGDPDGAYRALSPGTTPFAIVREEGMTPVGAFSFIPGYIGLIRVGERFDQPASFLRHYVALLRGEKPYGNDLFFEGPEAVIPALVDDLEVAEAELARENPTLYATVLRLQASEAERDNLTELNRGLASELDSQRQFVEVLRSGHAAKEIQEYYNREYEILPLWYKRAGHLLKVLTGKRTWRSLFRDDVKKYRD